MEKLVDIFQTYRMDEDSKQTKYFKVLMKGDFPFKNCIFQQNFRDIKNTKRWLKKLSTLPQVPFSHARLHDKIRNKTNKNLRKIKIKSFL